MGNPSSHKYLLVAVAFALTLVNVDLSSARAQTRPPPQPAKMREVDFTYHTEITGIDPKAHRVEAWIPLPREDRFQQVSDLRIDSPAQVEVVNQPTGGNRVVHLVAKVPPSGSIPVTIRFNVRRVEESADIEKAQANIPEPTGGAFDRFLTPGPPGSDRRTDKAGERQGGRSRPFFLRTSSGHLRLRNREHEL